MQTAADFNAFAATATEADLYLTMAEGLLAKALLDLRNAAYTTLNPVALQGLDTLSLYGQPTPLLIALPTGQLGTVRFLGNRDFDVLVDGKMDLWAYRELGTDALVLCAEYAKAIEDVYHDDPKSEGYRDDELFSSQYPLGRELPTHLREAFDREDEAYYEKNRAQR